MTHNSGRAKSTGTSELDSSTSSNNTNNLKKFSALALFVLANTSLLITLRFAAVNSNPKDEVISSTEVLFAELLKFIFSVICCFVIDANCSMSTFLHNLRKGIIDDEQHNDLLKLSVPAVLYTIQNNLQYVIDSGTLFLVLYQFKIISTALFYSTMLSRRISLREWCLILILAVGVGMAEASQNDIQAHHASNIVGIVSVTVSILTSGFAGVFFEKIMKDSSSSIWLINLQMSMLSVIFGMIACSTSDTEDLNKRGFLSGYSFYTYIVILIQAIVGLAVALVVRYADNIHKGFATSTSIVLASILDSFLFEDVVMNYTFCMGSLIVLMSTGGYLHMIGVIALRNPSSDTSAEPPKSNRGQGSSSLEKCMKPCISCAYLIMRPLEKLFDKDSSSQVKSVSDIEIGRSRQLQEVTIEEGGSTPVS